MVLDFGKEHLHLEPEDLARLSQAVHNGDISAVMRAYEHELKVIRTKKLHSTIRSC